MTVSQNHSNISEKGAAGVENEYFSQIVAFYFLQLTAQLPDRWLFPTENELRIKYPQHTTKPGKA